MESKINSNKPVLRKLLYYIKPHSFWLLLRVLGAAVSAAIDISLAFIIIRFVNLSIAGDRSGVVDTMIMMLITVVVGIIFSFLNKYSSGKMSACTVRDIRDKAVNHIRNMPVSHMENNHSGGFISSLTNDITNLQNFLENDFPNLFYQPLRFIGAFVFAIFISWKLLLCCLILMPVTILIVTLASKPIGKLSAQLQKNLEEVNSITQDSIGGLHMIKAFNLKEVIFSKYRKSIDKVLHKGLDIEKRNSLLMPVYILINIVPLVMCVFYGGYLTIEKQITAGGLIGFIQILNYLTQPLSMMTGLISSTRGAMGSAGHLLEIFDNEIEKTGGVSNKTEKSSNPIAFEGVSFDYSPEIKLFNNLTFAIPSGKVVALVGPSGSGKSTILKLLCSFYLPSEGSIKLFDKDLAEWNLAAARSEMSLISQDTYLFPVSILENISYGKENATMEDIINASKIAHAHDFIMELPEGYNTTCGERGAKLSGGQKQRISIARAILKDAPILLMDEATSALDTESEAVIQDTLEQFMKNRTVLVIAHRLSTIKNADEVLVLDKGSIVDSGTHDQLMGKEGLYKQLYLKQFAAQDYQQVAAIEKGG